jgi:hypothetical protein
MDLSYGRLRGGGGGGGGGGDGGTGGGGGGGSRGNYTYFYNELLTQKKLNIVRYNAVQFSIQ